MPEAGAVPQAESAAAPADDAAGAPRDTPPPMSSEERDLGFGSVVANQSRMRLLNPDGTFNVAREGLGFWGSLSIYHILLRMSWPRFLATLAAGYLVVNAIFALLYLACGPAALTGDAATGGGFTRAFFFSVQTFATIGFGQIAPQGIAPNLIVVAESLVGILGFTLATGLLFARFSRPTARIVFSHRAVIAPYRDGRAFMLRIANARRSEIIELGARVVLSLLEGPGPQRTRRFHTLALERHRVAFFPLAWTIVHPIDDASPLRNLDQAALAERQAEFLVLLVGTEETFSQTVHARSSYRADEVVWGARFADLFNRATGDGDLTIDMHRLHETVPAPLT